jgi:hypothetical protein
LEPPPVQSEEPEPTLETGPNQILVSTTDPEDKTETVMDIPRPPTGELRIDDGFGMISGSKGHSAHIMANGDHWIDINLVPFLMDGLRNQALKGTVEIFHQGHQWMGEPIEAMDLVELKEKLRAGSKRVPITEKEEIEDPMAGIPEGFDTWDHDRIFDTSNWRLELEEEWDRQGREDREDELIF